MKVSAYAFNMLRYSLVMDSVPLHEHPDIYGGPICAILTHFSNLFSFARVLYTYFCRRRTVFPLAFEALLHDIYSYLYTGMCDSDDASLSHPGKQECFLDCLRCMRQVSGFLRELNAFLNA